MMPATPSPTPMADLVAKPASFMFYTGYRNVVVTLPPEEGTSVSGERREFNCFVLHTELLPPSPVQCTSAREENEERYAQGIAASEGLELLRYNWHLLLVLCFPLKFTVKRTADPVEQVESQREMSSPDCAPICTAQQCEESSGFFLTPDELATMHSPDVMDKIHYSYIVFLRFFGWRLHDEVRGVVDRHRCWNLRYECLSKGLELDTECLDQSEIPTYDKFNFYGSGLPRITQSLLSLHLFRYAVGLVEFLIEEMTCDRLKFLWDLVDRELLPLLGRCRGVDKSHTFRLRKNLLAVVDSDSE